MYELHSRALEKLETIMEKVARTLSGKFDIVIKPSLRGAFSYGEYKRSGRVLTVPWMPPDWKPTEEELLQFEFAVRHEIGHAKFTDFSVLRDGKITDPKVKEIWNVIEDYRIEKLMEREFRGIEEINTEWWNNHARDVELHMINHSKESLTKQLSYAMTGSLRDTRLAGDNKFIDGLDPKLRKLLMIIEDELVDALNLVSDKNLLNICESIYKKLYKDIPPEEPEGDAKKEGGEEEKTKTVEAEEWDAPDMVDEPTDSEEEEEEEEDEEDDDEDDEEEEEEGKSGATSRDKVDKDDIEDDDEDGVGESDKRKEDEKETLKDLLEELRDEEEEEELTDEKIPDRVKEEYKEAVRFSEYVVPKCVMEEDKYFRKEKTEVDKVYKDTILLPIENKIKRQINNLKTELLFRLMTLKEERYHYELDEGIIDDNMIWKCCLPSTESPRIFKQQFKSWEPDTAVSIVSDFSGSMSWNNKLENSLVATKIISEVLSAINIPNEVIGFTSTTHSFLNKLMKKIKKELGEDTLNRLIDKKKIRLLPLRHYNLKNWNENFVEAEKNFYIKPELYENCDHESVLFAARRLAGRQEKRKILFVLSDGTPANGSTSLGILNKLLKDTVCKIENSGIEVIGIGMEDNAVEKFYKDNFVVNDIEDLPKKLLKIMDKKLFQRVTGVLT